MQITLTLPDQLVKQLFCQPNPEQFAQTAIQLALESLNHQQQNKSKWAKLVETVQANPIDLGDYTMQFKRDMQTIRQGFIFKHDKL